MQSQLLTWIDGVPTPPARSVEITRLAEAVVKIATIDDGGLELPDFPRLPSPRWQNRIRRTTVGRAALDRLLALPPPAPGGTPIHGDLCHANLLWHGDDLVGILDWDRASRGPSGVDTAMLWTDLLIRHGIAVAESFLGNVAAEGHTHDGLRYWQLRMVTSSLGGDISIGESTRLAEGFEHLAD